MKKKIKTYEIKDYDENDTSNWIDLSKNLTFEDLGFKLPPSPPTQVVSIRLPTRLLNTIKATASEDDVPYQALIKMALSKVFKNRYQDPS